MISPICESLVKILLGHVTMQINSMYLSVVIGLSPSLSPSAFIGLSPPLSLYLFIGLSPLSLCVYRSLSLRL